jgi:hypothetical protein
MLKNMKNILIDVNHIITMMIEIYDFFDILLFGVVLKTRLSMSNSCTFLQERKLRYVKVVWVR